MFLNALFVETSNVRSEGQYVNAEDLAEYFGKLPKGTLIPFREAEETEDAEVHPEIREFTVTFWVKEDC